MYRVLTAEYERPRKLRPEIPEELERILLQAMALEPAERPASAAELEHRLLAFCRPTFRDHQIERISSSGGFSFHTLSAGPTAPMSAPDLAAITEGSPGDSRAGGAAVAVPARDTDLTPLAESAVLAASIQAARTPRRTLWIAGAAVLLCGTIAGVLVMSNRGGGVDTGAPVGGPPAETGAPTQAAPPPPPPPTTAPTEVAAPAPAEITLRIATDPATAAIELDGVPVTARQLTVRKDNTVHKLRITAPGYAAHEETVRFDETQRVIVQLKRAATRPIRTVRPPRERIESKSPYEQ
jgi:serine/threonine-protein kinase